jgi:hypothetical protein
MDAAALHGLRVQRSKPNGQATDQTGLDHRPGFIDTLNTGCQFRGDLNPGVRNLSRDHLADRLIGLVLPQQRDRKGESGALRFDHITHSVGFGRRCYAFDDPQIVIDRFEMENGIRSIHTVSVAYLLIPRVYVCGKDFAKFRFRLLPLPNLRDLLDALADPGHTGHGHAVAERPVLRAISRRLPAIGDVEVIVREALKSATFPRRQSSDGHA